MSSTAFQLIPSDPEECNALLRRALLGRAHSERPQLLGLEFECLRVREQDSFAAPSFGEGGPDALVQVLAKGYLEPGQSVVSHVEDGVLSAVTAGTTNLSIEPGGQIEVSLPPFATPLQVGRALDAYIVRLEKELAKTPYRALFMGHQPYSMPDDIPLRNKPRYTIMDRRLQEAGSLGRHMMRATAGMQVTLDFRDEVECAQMLRGSLLMAPFITALFANSPLVGGRDSGYLSFRERVWWHTDPARCGVPEILINDNSSVQGYLDFALDAPVWFVNGDSGLVAIDPGLSFRDLLYDGRMLTLDDFNLHCSTLFPSTRIRGGIEVRSADCVPPDMAAAFCALHAGCLYVREVREAVVELHPYRDAKGLASLHEAVAKDGLHATDPRVGNLDSACSRLVDLAEQGLQSLIAAGTYERETLDLLRPLRCCLERRCSYARDAKKRFLGVA